MKTVEELTKELELAKKKRSQEEWESHLKQAEEYLNSLVGKTFIKYYSNGGLIMFKVKGFKQQHYLEQGMYGQFTPNRWFELIISSYITCRVSDDSGKWFRPEVKYSNFKFLTNRRKPQTLTEVADLRFVDSEKEQYVHAPDEIVVFGKQSHSGDINLQRDISNFKEFLREAPIGMWEAAVEIANDNIEKTKLFWEKFQPKVREL